MRSTVPMHIAKTGYIVSAVLLIALGIVLCCQPTLSVQTIGRYGGALMVLFGVFKLVGYFSKDLFRLAFQYDFAAGVLLELVGAVLLFRPTETVALLCGIVGVMVVADGLFKIQISMDARQFGLRAWWVILVMGLLTCVAGTLPVVQPSKNLAVLGVLLGTTLIAEGLLNLATAVAAVRIVANQVPDCGIVTSYERDEREEK